MKWKSFDLLNNLIEAFMLSFVSIVVAELGDKTQLSIISLTASLGRPFSIFAGMVLGYGVVAGLGVVAGEALLTVIPISVLTKASGLVFIIMGILMLRAGDNFSFGVSNPRLKDPFLATCVMIILAELGDKTQIVTIALAARFAQPTAVFVGVMSGFIIVDGLSIVLANRLAKRFPIAKIRKASAIIFLVLGFITLVGL